MKLYSYYRSSCSWRCRIVLHWYSIPHDTVPVNLLQGEQFGEQYVAVNPCCTVPSLVLDDGTVLGQSVAILEYLEAVHGVRDSSRRLLPADPLLAAITRYAVQIVTSGTQPLQNLRLVKAMGDKGEEWAKDVIDRGLSAFQTAIVERYGGQFSIGDTVTLADVVLVPQLHNARRFKVDMSKFGTLVQIEERLSGLPAFQAAAPDNQPDNPGKLASSA